MPDVEMASPAATTVVSSKQWNLSIPSCTETTSTDHTAIATPGAATGGPTAIPVPRPSQFPSSESTFLPSSNEPSYFLSVLLTIGLSIVPWMVSSSSIFLSKRKRRNSNGPIVGINSNRDGTPVSSWNITGGEAIMMTISWCC